MKRNSRLMRNLLAAVVALAVVVGVSGCRRRPKARPVPAPPPAAPAESETGLASWYGHPYHGRPTSSGEIYDMNKMTAAHRTLAFQTVVRVTNLENGKATEVRINDRGPFIEGRIVDLSRAAADILDIVRPGTALVRLDIVKRPPEDRQHPARYAVQVGAFKVEENARKLQQVLGAKYGDAFVQAYEGADGTYYRVRVGRQASVAEAQKLARRLRREPQVTATFVVRIN